MTDSNSQFVPLEDPERLDDAHPPNSRRVGKFLLAVSGIAALVGVAVVSRSSSHDFAKDAFDDAVTLDEIPPARLTHDATEPVATASQFARVTTVRTFNELLSNSIVEDPKSMYDAIPASQFTALSKDFLATMGSEAPDSSFIVRAPTGSYSTHVEHDHRFVVFQRNLFKIIHANHEEYVRNPTSLRARFGVTVHADWTDEEFEMTRLNLKASDTAAYIEEMHAYANKPNEALSDMRGQAKNRTAFGSPIEFIEDETGKECTIQTGGTCMVFNCHASRGAQCFEHNCICIDGSCSEGGSCVRPGNCQVSTGGSCHWFGCDSSRGADCVNGDCICAQGECAVDGKCVPDETPKENAHITCSSVFNGDVRNQGACGDCWAFSTAQQLRYMALKKTGVDPGTMSVQYLVDCMPEVQGKSCGSEGVKGCCGGLPYRADIWLEKVGGLPTEAAYGPLKSDKHPTQAYECHSAPKKIVPSGNPKIFRTEDEIANGYCSGGPVSIAINANSALMHYTGGIMTADACPPAGINHAVLYVGVAKHYDNGQPVHIVLNSWGSNWGVNTQDAKTFPYKHKPGTDNGHVLFKYGENTCNVMALASAPSGIEVL